MSDADIRALLAQVWADGYSAGLGDGCDDVLVSEQKANPYQ